MQTKFSSFLNENNSLIEVIEIGEELTSTIILYLKDNTDISSDDLEIFRRSSDYKTVFEIKIDFEHGEMEDAGELLSRCEYIRDIHSLTDSHDYKKAIPSWIDMGNGLENIVIEYSNKIKIYSGEEKLNDFISKLEEIIETETATNKYNI